MSSLSLTGVIGDSLVNLKDLTQNVEEIKVLQQKLDLCTDLVSETVELVESLTSMCVSSYMDEAFFTSSVTHFDKSAKSIPHSTPLPDRNSNIDLCGASNISAQDNKMLGNEEKNLEIRTLDFSGFSPISDSQAQDSKMFRTEEESLDVRHLDFSGFSPNYDRSANSNARPLEVGKSIKNGSTTNLESKKRNDFSNRVDPLQTIQNILGRLNDVQEVCKNIRKKAYNPNDSSRDNVHTPLTRNQSSEADALVDELTDTVGELPQITRVFNLRSRRVVAQQQQTRPRWKKPKDYV